jgi:predicted RNase H-like HicB family nuclease
MTRYEIILYWSAEDEAIAEWLETAQELGRPTPEPRGRLLFA